MTAGEATTSVLQRLMASGDAEPESIPEWRQAYRDAAAVLATFEPPRLQPFAHESVPDAWHKLLADCEPVDAPFGPGRWRLRDHVRRGALRRLHERGELARALESNPSRERNDPLQIAIETIIADEIPSLFKLRREDLAAYGVAREWFDGIVPVPSEAELRAALPIAEVLSPLRQLADGFVGRQSELAMLEDFVGALDARSIRSVVRRGIGAVAASVSGRLPLFVHGPGGVGKSTLIAKFVLEHVDVASDLRLPFAYLDIDRPVIDPQRPATLLLEAMRQLRLQFPDQADELSAMIDELKAGLERVDPHEVYKSHSPQDRAMWGFIDWAQARLVHETAQPLVLVVDTFEEVQFLGNSAVDGVWRLLDQLQSEIDTLRVVVAGRALPRERGCKPLLLSELDSEGARALLRRRIEMDVAHLGEPPSDRQLDEIMGVVGRSPMSLRLAAQIVAQQGIEKLRGVETRNFLFLHLRTEKVQAQLYGRILAHIHDPAVRRLAYPGLVVRRITPQVIREVLAAPCGVTLDTPDAADTLFAALARELALFEPDVPTGQAADATGPVEPGGAGASPAAVRHRLDVRRMMLRDLLSNVPARTVRSIDEGAVAYYARQPGPRARAEEIYHRLRLAQPLDQVAARWIEGVGDHLRTAPEELPPRQRLWLTTRLGATPPTELLAEADLDTWEENIARDAQRALEAGSPRSVLDIMAVRRERTAASPLFRLEAEAHRLIGDNEAARACALRGIESAAAAGDGTVSLDLHLFVAAIDEGEDKLEAAMTRLEAARPLVAEGDTGADALRLLTARIRLRRLLGREFDCEREELIGQLSALLTPAAMTELRGRPALLRELVAEVGDRNVELVRVGLDVVGLELGDGAPLQRLLEALADANRTAGLASPITKALAANKVADATTGRFDPAALANAAGGIVGLLKIVFDIVAPDSAPSLLMRAVSDVYRAAVSKSIKPRSDKQP